MNIYHIVKTFDSLYESNYRHTKKLFKKAHPEAYDFIINNTYLTPTSTWAEIVYVITHNITETPPCETCGQRTTWNKQTRNGYYRFCSSKCSIHLANDAARSEATKIKRATTVKQKYGVANPSHAPEIKSVISAKASERWAEVYKGKDFTADGLTRDQYGRRCWQYADTQYRRYKHLIDPDNLRSNKWHVDHIYSVTDGFINDVPINVISDITNLRLIKARENYRKHSKSDKSLKALYDDYANGPNRNPLC